MKTIPKIGDVVVININQVICEQKGVIVDIMSWSMFPLRTMLIDGSVEYFMLSEVEVLDDPQRPT